MIRPGVYYGQSNRPRDAMPPLVSVIVRSMDRPQLPDALDSISLQTYQNIEIVLVNAKGEDHSPISDWRGRFPIRFISSQSPLSRARAANVGLQSARGDYVAFLDDDDIFYPDHVAALVLALQNSNKIRVAYAGVRVEYFVDGKVTRSGEFRQEFDLAQLRGRNYIPNNAVLFERSLCDKGCRFDESLTVLEDWDFWLQLSLHSAFIYLDQVSACYRNYGDSGFGDSIRYDYLLKTTAAVFEKWKSVLSGEQLAEMILHRDAVNERCERTIAGLQDELRERERHSQVQEQETASLQAQFVAHEAMLRGQLQSNTTLLAHLSDREEELTRHQRDNSLLRMELAGQESKIADAASAIAGLKGTINDLRQSTSWRITTPMRSVVALLRRCRH
jgi:GT2 family glycosyltransferase